MTIVEVMLSVFQLLICNVHPSRDKCDPCNFFVLLLVSCIADIGDYVM